MTSLIIERPGLQTTIQDLGRPTHQIDGFPTSGAMDRIAHQLANVLVGNEANAATIEFALIGPTIKFKTDTFIAVTGGQFPMQLNGQFASMNRCLQVHANDKLEIGTATRGRFGCLAVKGGLLVPKVLDSVATTQRLGIGGFHGRALNSDDQLPIEKHLTLTNYAHRQLAAAKLPMIDEPVSLRVLTGPQWETFSSASQRAFISQPYRVSLQSDRMGYRLEGPTLDTATKSLLSEATVFGGIQVPANGQPIVLLADRQTTGGYPVIATVISADFSKLAQCQPNQTIQFSIVDLATARQALIDQATRLKQSQLRLTNTAYLPPYGLNRVAAQRIQTLFEQD